jgi:glycosyltransferase 2 family protein
MDKLKRLMTGFWSNRSKILSSKWWRAIGIVLILTSLGLMGRALALNLAQFKAVQIKVNLISFLIGLLFDWIAVWMGAFAWGEIVRALNPDVPYRDAINYHLVSIATKYLPGPGWQQVSKVYQLYRGGVQAGQVWQAVVLEMVLVVLVGLAIAVQFLITTGKVLLGASAAPGLQLGIAILIWVCCALAPIVVLRFFRTQIVGRTAARQLLLHLWFAEWLDIVGWFSLGTSLWFAINGITHLSINALPYCIITLIVSIIGGLAIVFVPNGIGVREAVMFTMLQSVLPIPLSIMVALIFRIVSVLAELLGVFPMLVKALWRKWIRKPSQSSHE